MTKCSTQLSFGFKRKKKLMVDFCGGEIPSDSGLLLMRQADERLSLSKGLSESIIDRRDSRYTEHNLRTLVV